MTQKAPLFHIVLFAPSIPLNVGSIARLAVCTGCHLHLIRPLGFSLSERQLRRAGLDYWQHLCPSVHNDWHQFLETEQPERLIFASVRGSRSIYHYSFSQGDYLVFGNEQQGLPDEFYHIYSDQLYHIPMPGEHSRTLNLANSASIVVYEGIRQLFYTQKGVPS